jgi:hypothetical protein
MKKLRAGSFYRGDNGSKVQLCLDQSSQSADALRVMLASGRNFRALYKGFEFTSAGFTLPTLFSLSGMFRGLAAITMFAHSPQE